MRCGSDTPGRSEYRIEDNILFGKYRLVSTLGIGGSSKVYLAEHLKLKTYRAIKCIPKGTAQKSSLCLEGSFPTEAELLKRLKHPGIPLIYDIDEDDGYIYIIEEYVQGDSLEVFLRTQENISQELMIQFGIQICDILDYLHHLAPNPVLYQDLKPENVIVCGDRFKLIDFGIASFFTGSGQSFQAQGTDGFVAPEILNGAPPDPAADIYSLGKILSYMKEVTHVSCSPQLSEIIEKAAAASKADRFETAAELKVALIGARQYACRPSSHLVRNISVIGSRIGVGSTHAAMSLVCALGKLGVDAVYVATADTDIIPAKAKEADGIYSYGYFRGVPPYGEGVADPVPAECIRVTDYGHDRSGNMQPPGNARTDCARQPSRNTHDWQRPGKSLQPAEDLILCVLSGSDWDFAESLSYARHLMTQQAMQQTARHRDGEFSENHRKAHHMQHRDEQLKEHRQAHHLPHATTSGDIVFACGMGNAKAARKFATMLETKVYCLPFNPDPCHVTDEWERLVSDILKIRKGGNQLFSALIKKRQGK